MENLAENNDGNNKTEQNFYLPVKMIYTNKKYIYLHNITHVCTYILKINCSNK